MVFSLASVSVFADDPEPGSIYITNYTEGVTYEIYKLLDLPTYNADAEAYSYTVNSDWATFFQSGPGADYVEFDGDYVKWKGSDDAERVAGFAKIALKYAEDNGISSVKSSANSGDAVKEGSGLRFSGLEVGYYLVDTTMGALCGLTTTNPEGVITAKNGAPTLFKHVQEDSTNQYLDVNTADIGQEVNFRITINVHAGAQQYIIHDNMNQKFNYKGISKIEHLNPSTNETKVLQEGRDYTIFTAKDITPETTDDTTDGCTFEVHFTEAACNTFKTNDKVMVYYKGMLNRSANIGNETGNKNTAWLSYGEVQLETNHVETTTYTYAVDLVKTDAANKLLDGAEFRVYDAATGGNEVKFVKLEEDSTGKITVYRRARADETGETVIVADGKVRLVGLDNGTYYLEETKNPDGYNILTSRQGFTISDGNLDAEFKDGVYSKGSGVHVVNKTGSMLPETGGMGTMMFVLIGAIVVIGAGVLLVTKKRMSMIED